MTDAELTELKAKAQAMMDGGDAFFADELITAALEGKKLPSTTYRLSRSCALQFVSRTLLFGSRPNRSVPH